MKFESLGAEEKKMIKHVEKNNIFVLETKSFHYVLGIDGEGFNRHIHWGEKCDVNDYEFEAVHGISSNDPALNGIKQEITPFGSTMYRECDIKARFEDGCREIFLVYKGFEQNGDTLKLRFEDEYYPLGVTLCYEVFEEYDIIKRYVTLTNTGNDDIVFERIFSAEFTLPSSEPYTFRNTNGTYGSEFLESDTLLNGGDLVFETRKGGSTHNNSPYFIAYQNADERGGDVFFATLAFSGNFKVSASRDAYSITRVSVGMNDFDFSHTLKPSASFDTPPVYCGKANGFGEMSRNMNRFCVDKLLPKQFNKKPLPVLYNSWEATYFDVNTVHQSALAKTAASIGVELFVMDDGWFGKRNNDLAGLGDWYVNKEKFPNGLDELIENVNAQGMDFGLWVEPEMVNPDSDLYRAHPDWVYHFEHRHADELRNQLVLNMTRDDVREYIFGRLDELLEKHNIKYIKWDMNRPFSQVGAENLENPQMYSYLHIMAVYGIVDELKKRHPQVQFESCASGGGRCDLGALSHFDQIWTSDNTDAVDRMTIQRGYSMLRPTKAMRAWVTDTTGLNKPCSLDFRFNVAMQGALGIGGNLTKYSGEDLEICRKNISFYKSVRDLVQFGDLYRISDALTEEILCNEYVSRDKNRAVVFIAAKGTRFYKKQDEFRLAGLDENKKYKFTLDGEEHIKGGAYLMNIGISMYVRCADYNRTIIFEAVK